MYGMRKQTRLLMFVNVQYIQEVSLPYDTTPM